MEPAAAAAALARNDAYLRTFVEAFHVCPFAQACRTEGRLHREVIEGTVPAIEAVLADRIDALHRREDAFEIGLLLVPGYCAGPAAFERAVAQAADGVRQGRAARGEAMDFHVVAFHPELPWSDGDGYRLIGLLRHSPDPTVQLVRIAVLDALRGAGAGPPRWVDASDPAALAQLEAAQLAQPLSERIAQANLRTYRALSAAMHAALAQAAPTSDVTNKE